MSIESDGVLQEALRLPNRERAAVAAELLASLDDAPVGDQAVVAVEWAEELERRARRALSGEDAGEPWEALRDRLRLKISASLAGPTLG